jgi:RNA polymerase sigma-70 factor, ECF subfamily
MARDVTRGVTTATLSSGMPDAASASAANDLANLRELYAQHSDFVRRAVLRVGGPAIDADDLTHEVFLVALRKWGRLPPETEPRAWLHGVATRAVWAARRKTRWRRRLGLAQAPTELPAPAPDADFERAEARARVYRLVDHMSEKKRSVFLMFEIEGLSGEEIASVVGCPLKTVWTRLFHARREFLAALEREKEREA